MAAGQRAPSLRRARNCPSRMRADAAVGFKRWTCSRKWCCNNVKGLAVGHCFIQSFLGALVLLFVSSLYRIPTARGRKKGIAWSKIEVWRQKKKGQTERLSFLSSCQVLVCQFTTSCCLQCSERSLSNKIQSFELGLGDALWRVSDERREVS